MAKQPAHNGNLSPKQTALLAALVRGEPIDAAAKSANTSLRTAYRWQREVPFQDALQLAQTHAFDNTLKRLLTGTGQALDLLEKAMTDKKCPYNVRVTAAKAWLENALVIHKAGQLEQKINELEELLLQGESLFG